MGGTLTASWARYPITSRFCWVKIPWRLRHGTGTCIECLVRRPGGIAARAIAGVELALWDIKGKAMGVPVHSLFGGPTRERQQVYWSHCGSSRSRNHELIGSPPMDSFQAVTDLGQEVKERGFKALKTNIIFFDDDNLGYGYGFGTGAMDQTITPALLQARGEIHRHVQGGRRAGCGDCA